MEATTELANNAAAALIDLWISASGSVGRGDDKGFESEDLRKEAIAEAEKVLRDPNASQKDKSQAKRRIQELSRQASKRAHGGDQLLATDPILYTDLPRLGCRKACE